MNAIHTILALAAITLTVTGPDGPWLVCWGALLALTGWRVFVAYHGEVRTSSTHPAIIRAWRTSELWKEPDHDPQSKGI